MAQSRQKEVELIELSVHKPMKPCTDKYGGLRIEQVYHALKIASKSDTWPSVETSAAISARFVDRYFDHLKCRAQVIFPNFLHFFLSHLVMPYREQRAKLIDCIIMILIGYSNNMCVLCYKCITLKKKKKKICISVNSDVCWWYHISATEESRRSWNNTNNKRRKNPSWGSR